MISFSQNEMSNMNHHHYPINLCSLCSVVYPVLSSTLNWLNSKFPVFQSFALQVEVMLWLPLQYRSGALFVSSGRAGPDCVDSYCVELAVSCCQTGITSWSPPPAENQYHKQRNTERVRSVSCQNLIKRIEFRWPLTVRSRQKYLKQAPVLRPLELVLKKECRLWRKVTRTTVLLTATRSASLVLDSRHLAYFTHLILTKPAEVGTVSFLFHRRGNWGARKLRNSLFAQKWQSGAQTHWHCALTPHWTTSNQTWGTNPGSATHVSGQVTEPLWVLVSPLIKWGFLAKWTRG